MNPLIIFRAKYLSLKLLILFKTSYISSLHNRVLYLLVPSNASAVSSSYSVFTEQYLADSDHRMPLPQL